MKNTLMLTAAGLLLVAAPYAAEKSATELREAAKSITEAADHRDAQVKAEVSADIEQRKANKEAVAAEATDSVSATVSHRLNQAGHKINQATDKVKAGYHDTMADHYQNKAAAEVSASLEVK